MSIEIRATHNGLTTLGIPTKELKNIAAATPTRTTGTTGLRNTQEIMKAKAIAFPSPGAHTTATVNTQG